MNVLLKSAKIIDRHSQYHQKTVDVYIKDGIINNIAEQIDCPENTKEISLNGLHISNGWFDASVSFGEPGFEEREHLVNGIQTAIKSGFTQVAINSNCQPKIDSKSVVCFIKSKAFGQPIDLHPIGSLTQNSEGKDMAELYDMQQNGAIAFGDYHQSIENANLMKVALQYTQSFNGLVLSYPSTKNIVGKGVVNEGLNGIKSGLKGIPALAEELQISRDLFLLEYTGGKLHIPTISTQKSVDLIRAAKAKGLAVTCSVSAHHLTLTDDEITSFDSNYKIKPPLRTQTDVHALLDGLKDDTIDCIVSDHNPIDIENKKLEFANALYGSIGLESLFVSLNGTLDLALLIDKISYQPKQVFGLKYNAIEIGKPAELSLFNVEDKGVFTKNDILSTSKNSAYLNKPTLGKVYGTYYKSTLTLT